MDGPVEVMDASASRRITGSASDMGRTLERASLEDGYELAEHPILPATDENSFRAGLQEHYRRVRQDVMLHLRDVYDFALWFDAYAVKQQKRQRLRLRVRHFKEKDMSERVTYVNADHMIAGKGVAQRRESARLLRPCARSGEIGWKYATVRKYRSLAGFENLGRSIAKCGSVRKALEWCADQSRTDAERQRAQAKESEHENEGTRPRARETRARAAVGREVASASTSLRKRCGWPWSAPIRAR